MSLHRRAARGAPGATYLDTALLTTSLALREVFRPLHHISIQRTSTNLDNSRPESTRPFNGSPPCYDIYHCTQQSFAQQRLVNMAIPFFGRDRAQQLSWPSLTRDPSTSNEDSQSWRSVFAIASVKCSPYRWPTRPESAAVDADESRFAHV